MANRTYTNYIVIILACLGVVAAFLYSYYIHNKIYSTPWGFFPSEISVPIGTTVTFVNLGNTLIWPASDVHPDHTAYPEFDPRRGIPRGESWSFTFQRTGHWSFHDHLSTQFTGKVIVRDEDGNADFNCAEGDTVACWGTALDVMVKEEGVDAAYALMVDIHQEYPNFAVRCHRYAHDIGLKSYIYYGTDVTLTPKTSYCNAGFFHGYMEGLISSTDNMTQAVDFCARVDRELNSEFPLAYSQCLHGIGHGVLEHFILTRPDLLSTPAKLIAEAVAVCESTIRDNDDGLMRCASGAYNVFRDFVSRNDEYAVLTLDENLYSICAAAATWYTKQGCYWEMSKLYSWNVPSVLDDIEKAGTSKRYRLEKMIAKEDQEEYLPFATRSWANIVGKHAVYEYSENTVIKACDLVPRYAKESCLIGMFEGAFSSAEPQREIDVMKRLCASGELDEKERVLCYAQFQIALATNYTASVYESQCEIIPDKYRAAGVCQGLGEE